MNTDKQKLLNALNELVKAHKTINEIWSDELDETSDGQLNKALCELYPYDRCFNELYHDLALWVASVNTDLSEAE